MRLTEPQAGKKRLVRFFLLIEPIDGFVDNHLGHPTLGSIYLFTIAYKAFGVFAKIFGVSKPMIETMITRIGLST